MHSLWPRGNGNGGNMAVHFPNQSRSYDSTRRAVHFWGHDRAMESSFFVTADALSQIQPNLQPGEAGFLRAFDLNRDLIHAAAARVFARGRKGRYEINAADFE
jgi:hypothetical protein